MNRRSFLSSILAACATGAGVGAFPAIVRTDRLMRVVPWDTLVLPSVDMGGGILRLYSGGVMGSGTLLAEIPMATVGDLAFEGYSPLTAAVTDWTITTKRGTRPVGFSQSCVVTGDRILVMLGMT